MPSVSGNSVSANVASEMTATAAITPSPPPSLQCGTSEEYLTMEHLTRSEVFAKKPLQRVTSNGEVTSASECNNGGNMEQFTLLPGECARLYSTLSNGIFITLTNFRLFVLLHGGNGFYNIPIRSIDSVECRDMFYLHLACKDGRVAKITFENNESCLSWWRLLNSAIAAPSKLEDVFAFAFHAWCTDEKAENGLCLRSTDVYLPSDLKTKGCQVDDHKLFTELEFSRLEFDPAIWRITELNKDYRFCSTYPKYWIVPASITDSEIESAGRYRSMRRVPAVVWRHRGNGAVLVRCSQPESGIFGWRSPADESLLNAITTSCARQQATVENNVTGAAPHSSPVQSSPAYNGDGASSNHIPGVDTLSSLPLNAKHMLILDARSYTAAWANRAKGGGYESTEYYQKCEIQFLGLANIHSIRYSFQKLRTLCWESPETNWFQSLDACQWIYHLWALLASAVRVADALHVDGRPVLVHCSDGWDRTTQIVSLAKLFLDPHYRTMQGFKELIEREWIAFGHKFAERSGTTAGDINQRAPVFLQWLDCVHYVLKENPCAFEFNEAYLVKLAQHVYSGLFGTFLCNSIAEYVNANVASQTFSIWSFLHPANRQFRNVFYVGGSCRPILPRFQQRDLAEIWRTVYCPLSDPANIRPRSFSTASMDGDNAAIAINKSAATTALASERTLTRAHSCDNLVSSTPLSTSLDNLPIMADKAQCSLHRTGSESSLTKTSGPVGGSGVHNPGGAAHVERDTEEVVRSILDTVEKQTKGSCDFNGEPVATGKRGLDSSPDLMKPSFADQVNATNENHAIEPTSDVNSFQEGRYQSQERALVDLANVRSNTVSTTTVVDEIAGGTDISTSTTDLNFCCGNLVARGGRLGHGCRRFSGIFCDLNANCPVNCPAADGRNSHALSNGERMATVAEVAGTDGAVSACYRTVEPSTLCAFNGGRRGKLSPKDMIDTDGMTKVADAPQQRVREMIHNYERQLEDVTLELEQLRYYVRQQHQNGLNCFCAERKKHLSVDDGADSLEPHSFGSHGNASDASWEPVDERETQPVLWMPDHTSNRCLRCDAIFTVINRRHHCRCCGRLFCSACSSYESPVPEEQLYDRVRVCSWCYASLRQREPSSSSQPTSRQLGMTYHREQSPAHQQPQPPQQQQQEAQHLQQGRDSQHQVLPQQKVSA